MDLHQSKLSKTEWNNTEVPVVNREVHFIRCEKWIFECANIGEHE